MYPGVSIGDSFSISHPKGHFFSAYKADPNKVLNTVMPNDKDRRGAFHYEQLRTLTKREIILASTFPIDYEPRTVSISYVFGMSVPPVMAAQIASRVYDQWLSKI
jgi:DNA (cytosine-5)-methyltransferase 1